MNDIEAKVRCLEIAERIGGRTGDRNPQGLAEIASKLYTWVKSEDQPPPPKRRGRSPRKEDNVLD